MTQLHKRRFKTDNHALARKIALRRWLIDRLGFPELHVLDTCSGEGVVWSAMDAHATIRRWVKCDRRGRRPGTLQIEAVDAIRALPLHEFNVVDIDPYGDPWDAYYALLTRLTRPTAVFLTCGHFGAGSSLAHATMTALGLPPEWDVRPDATLPRIPPDVIAGLMLAQTWKYASIAHAATVEGKRSGASVVSYYALGLEPW